MLYFIDFSELLISKKLKLKYKIFHNFFYIQFLHEDSEVHKMPKLSKGVRKQRNKLEEEFQAIYIKQTQKYGGAPNQPLKFYHLRRLLELFADPETFETKMRILHTREQFFVQLKVRSPKPFSSEDTHLLVAAIARIEISVGFHVYGWANLFRGTVNSFFEAHIIRLRISNELKRETIELIKQSNILKTTSTFQKVFAPLECPELADEGTAVEATAREERAAFEARKVYSAEDSRKRQKRIDEIQGGSIEKFNQTYVTKSHTLSFDEESVPISSDHLKWILEKFPNTNEFQECMRIGKKPFLAMLKLNKKALAVDIVNNIVN